MTVSVTLDPVLPDKIQLLMEEASCDRAEAELAMSLAGFDLEKAIRTIGTLLRHIVIVKAKFVETEQNLHGLLILIADTRRDHFLRARAVVSYNPALYETGLGQHWYDFERCIYSARLGEGALQQVSQDLERTFIERMETRREIFFSALKADQQSALSAVLNDGWAASFPRGVVSEFSPEVIDWNQFRRFPLKSDERASVARSPGAVPTKLSGAASGSEDVVLPHDISPDGRPHAPGETLRIHLEVVGDENGSPVGEVRVGDRIPVVVSDERDIAHYIAKLFGAMADGGPLPFEAPVETIQKEGDLVFLHIRLSAGILGLAEAPPQFRVQILPRESDPWWRRLWSRHPD
ncbi:MAG: hypothetical protein IPN90_07410 [Elusimicrobia bacterium]|nr:hypothetical protein [Elusimicrobiota bacterium]